MSLFPSLFFPMLWALEGRASPDLRVDGSGIGPSRRTHRHIRHEMKREGVFVPLDVTCDCPNDVAELRSPPARRTTEMFNAHPRSLDSSSSSIAHPLLVGILIGVVGTLFSIGFIYILYRVYHRSQDLKRRRRILPRPSAPLEFRHLQHVSTGLSNSPSSADSLRVAHRRPDGSWAFTDAVYDRDRADGPDPTLPYTSTGTAPWSPAASNMSPTTASDSSATAFSHEMMDASSSKTGPPPYPFPNEYPPSPPVPSIPRPQESEKSRGRWPRR